MVAWRYKPDEVCRYRCASCGVIQWTTRALGCKSCSSDSLEDFPELDGHLSPPQLVRQLSKDLAQLARSQQSIEDLARGYLTPVFDGLRYLPAGGAYYKATYQELVAVLTNFLNQGISPVIAIQKFVALWERAQEDDKQIAKATVSGFKSILQHRVQGSAPQPPVLLVVSGGREFVDRLLQDDGGAKAEVEGKLNSYERDQVSSALLDFAAEVGSVREEFLPLPAGTYGVMVPCQYHINLGEMMWSSLRNATKLAPLLFALVRLELPHYAELVAAAEAIRTIAENITKLEERSGELCIYRAITFARSTLGRYPTSDDIERELRAVPCCYRQCKFFRRDGVDCAVTKGDIEAILAFLKQRKVVKEVAPKEWWVSL